MVDGREHNRYNLGKYNKREIDSFMKLMRKLAVLGVIGVVGMMALPAGRAGAVINDRIEWLGQEFQIALHPTHIEFDLVPGTTTGETFRVRNVGSMETDLKIGITTQNFSGGVNATGTPRDDILGWTTIALEPGCTATEVDPKGNYLLVHMRVKEECFVQFSTTTPSNAPFGEQYMNVYFQEYSESEEGGLQAIRSIGANVYGTNRTGSGEGDVCGKVIDQSIPFWVFEGPIDTTTIIENCGRLNFHAKIRIEVYNLFGALVYEEQTPKDRVIAVETEREVKDSWAETSIGIYRTVQTVEVLGETYVKEGWTFLIPLWLIVVVLLCLLVVALAIVHDRKKKQTGRSRK